MREERVRSNGGKKEKKIEMEEGEREFGYEGEERANVVSYKRCLLREG